MSKKLANRFQTLWSDNRVFVFYRFPNTPKISLYIQNDLEIVKTTDFSTPGFVIAPFDHEKEYYLIPKDQFEEFEIEFNQKTLQHKNTLHDLSIDEKKYLLLVEKAKNYISNKKSEKVVVSTFGEITLKHSPSHWISNLFTNYPNAFVSFFHHPKLGTWFGATPEILLEKRKNNYKTIALAGTKSNSSIQTRKWTKKEKEEQKIVQDQIQTDLAKLVPKINVEKSETTDYKIGHLIHLITYFHFKSNLHPRLIIKKIHPTAAIAGIPRKESVDFIKENESYNRHFYSGIIGPISHDNFTLFVNLRCAQLIDKTAKMYVGAGITKESDPNKEFNEVLNKAQTLLRILK